MKKNILLALLLVCSIASFAQNTLTGIVKDAKNTLPLSGASIAINNKQVVSDSTGAFRITGLPDGEYGIRITFVGYEEFSQAVKLPLTDINPMIFLLEADAHGEDVDEVTVSATRTSRTIANIPTRVEAISGEELEEKANMKPGDIRMVLSESTGVQTQQTSATSGNSSIRIQGLDGKYTQIIRDGLPLYAGFSGGLGLLQVAPLDLKQIEIIKGSSSTLYGGGAIAGLVNLVSKTPQDDRELNFLANVTSAGGLDLSTFYSERYGSTGTTIYAAYNRAAAYAPGSSDFTAIPKYDRFTLNPRFFYYAGDNTTITTGVNATVESRIGGDLHYVKQDGLAGHTYFEENTTRRYSLQNTVDHNLDENRRLSFKNSISYYNRQIGMQNYIFAGVQLSTYSELNFTAKTETSDWVIGLNYLSDSFNERRVSNSPVRDYKQHTAGLFIQNNWDITDKFTLESGFRGDHHNQYGFLALPRLSALWRVTNKWTARLGGGLGYKAPNVFTEDAERIQFRDVLPVSVNKLERSYGTNFDIDFKTPLFDGATFTINQLFFYTRINNPVILTPTGSGMLRYLQPAGELNTKGTETNMKLVYGDFKLFVGYTFADVSQHSGSQTTTYPLVSKHRLNNVLMYELEEKWKIGLEAYYFSRQLLNDNAWGKAYWTTGFMAERIWKRFSVYMNFENFTDTRQTKFDTIYNGTINQPVFRDIYAPVDGFVVNGGIKVKF